MFKFNFDVSETDEHLAELLFAGSAPSASSTPERSHLQDQARRVDEDPSKEIAIDDLIAALPHTFSFSPLAVQLASKRDVVLSRRDLFDARFQLIASDEDIRTDDGRTAVDFLDAPSDLVPWVYEGGLKTWECSLDLVDCLDTIYGPGIARNLKAKRVLELGCGTAIPSLYLLKAVFMAEPSAESDIHIHLQDYNELVLRLVTLPNVILAWYMSPASAAFRESAAANPQSPPADADADADAEPEPLPPADVTDPGELPITPALTAAFLASLRLYGVHLKFFSGAWSTFDVAGAGGPHHLVLTSETIYRTDSLGSLVALLQRATATAPEQGARRDSPGIVEWASRLSMTDEAGLHELAYEPYLCLVAGKTVYFGVGGGVNEFVQAVEGEGRGMVRTIWERVHGVKRSVMRVVWNAT